FCQNLMEKMFGFYLSSLLGNIPGDWVGMEFDRSTGILYALSGPILYTIDPDDVTATLVGVTGINIDDIPVALAIDGNGVGYTYDLLNKLFYSIDLSTGASTVIGDIGFDANYGQGMTYDPTTDTVYMSAFNNSTFAAEWRSVDLATGATTFIGNMVNGIGDAQVAWVSIGETLAPPACPRPLSLAVSNIMSTSVDLSWDPEPNASSGYIWYVFQAGANPLIDSPVATGTTPLGTSTVTATDLSGGLIYDFYVVADCDSEGLSQFAGPVTFATIPVCGGKFYDMGGPLEHYNDGADETTTITPEDAGDAVTVTFTEFNTEYGRDALYVYDGPDASSPIISSGNPATVGGFPAGGYYGDTIPGPFTSTHSSGTLTFVFRSDGSVSYPGWEADVTCTTMGTGENLLEDFSFYPNPTDGMLNLKSADNIENVTLYNVLGQMVITKAVNARTSQLDVSGLSTGTYLMKVMVNGQSGTYRLLKQ
ncbi:MAG: T9SS type A sorting domain-containing protein, partial [Aequorivita sp.]